jgi:hypothetical protein
MSYPRSHPMNAIDINTVRGKRGHGLRITAANQDKPKSEVVRIMYETPALDPRNSFTSVKEAAHYFDWYHEQPQYGLQRSNVVEEGDDALIAARERMRVARSAEVLKAKKLARLREETAAAEREHAEAIDAVRHAQESYKETLAQKAMR